MNYMKPAPVLNNISTISFSTSAYIINSFTDVNGNVYYGTLSSSVKISRPPNYTSPVTLSWTGVLAYDLCVNSKGNIYFVDYNYKCYVIPYASGYTTNQTVVPTAFYTPNTGTRSGSLRPICVDNNDNIYYYSFNQGKLLKINEAGTATILYDGYTLVTSLSFDASYNLYISMKPLNTTSLYKIPNSSLNSIFTLPTALYTITETGVTYVFSVTTTGTIYFLKHSDHIDYINVLRPPYTTLTTYTKFKFPANIFQQNIDIDASNNMYVSYFIGSSYYIYKITDPNL